MLSAWKKEGVYRSVIKKNYFCTYLLRRVYKARSKSKDIEEYIFHLIAVSFYNYEFYKNE